MPVSRSSLFGTATPTPGAAVDGSDHKDRTRLLIAGFAGGFLQAGIFNPWDRALYLSIKDRRPFLNAKNFANPWAGVTQTIFQRALSSGLYFPLEEIFADQIVSSGLFGTSAPQVAANRTWIALAAGLLAGMTNGLLMNPLAAIKYNFWGRSDRSRTHTFLDAAREMYKRGGIRMYYVGAAATISRDLVFGGVYGVLRHEMPIMVLSKPSFISNLIAAMVATVLSSPWNYIRNVHYATPYGQAPELPFAIISKLWKSARKQRPLLQQIFHLQTQLRVGWGTARVGCGMAFSSQVYAFISGKQ
eukprot:GSChrysophyteH1.ASY1.ANO1.935.1 assembled CDS